MCDIGLGYDVIHDRKYDYTLYWKESIDYQQCQVCGKSQYKVNEGNSKKDLT